jgi:hypothetical protein
VALTPQTLQEPLIFRVGGEQGGSGWGGGKGGRAAVVEEVDIKPEESRVSRAEVAVAKKGKAKLVPWEEGGGQPAVHSQDPLQAMACGGRAVKGSGAAGKDTGGEG